jgi:hypothetical protein
LPNGYGDFIKASAPYWNSVDEVWEERASYVRNVGHALFDGDGGESWGNNSAGTLTLQFYLANALQNSLLAPTDTTTALSNRLIQKNGSDEEYFRVSTPATTLVVSVLKTRIGWTSGDDDSKVTAFKAWLASNNLYIAYLSTATEHTPTPESVVKAV